MHHHQSQITGVAPAYLERVVSHQRAALPDDADALDRLFQQIELSRPMLAEIRAAVCDFYCIHPLELRGRYRECETALARQIFCFLAWKYTGFSLGQIGGYVGLVNHSTVHHAVRKVQKLAITKPLVADDIDQLRLRISERVLARRKAFAC